MSHFGDYMDDVPVKISEKYKRPPRLDLPYGVIECPARAKRVVETSRYCTTFERNILSKLKELQSAKGIKKSERRHRLQLLEEAKQKKLDAIAAAETEEKLKQLSVSEVSYPSTDEISAISPEDKLDKPCDTSPVQDNSPEAEEAVDVNYHCATTIESQPNILQPIQVQSNLQQNNLLDDPDPLQELKLNSKIAKIPQYNRNVDTLSFKDFENDTSSPFDNVELKTINDMEQLAQVLQSQRESADSCPGHLNSGPPLQVGCPPHQPLQVGCPSHQPIQTIQPQPYPGYANCGTQAQMESVTYLPNAYIDQQVHPGLIYASPPHYPITNGYYIPEPVCENSIPLENVYMPNYHYLVPAAAIPTVSAQPYAVTDPYYNQLPTTSAEVSQVPNGSSYIPHPYYFHYPHIPMQYVTPPYNPVAESKHREAKASTQNTVKSRSRSVPDIVRELNEELALASLRSTERSVSPGGHTRYGPNTEKTVERRYWKKIERLPNPLQTFTPIQQRMCENIHSMGFPLDRVARVFSLVGENDKKVIECLLILGELMDLGFTESKATEALVKHQFNRDKALDELVA